MRQHLSPEQIARLLREEEEELLPDADIESSNSYTLDKPLYNVTVRHKNGKDYQAIAVIPHRDYLYVLVDHDRNRRSRMDSYERRYASLLKSWCRNGGNRYRRYLTAKAFPEFFTIKKKFILGHLPPGFKRDYKSEKQFNQIIEKRTLGSVRIDEASHILLDIRKKVYDLRIPIPDENLFFLKSCILKDPQTWDRIFLDNYGYLLDYERFRDIMRVVMMNRVTYYVQNYPKDLRNTLILMMERLWINETKDGSTTISLYPQELVQKSGFGILMPRIVRRKDVNELSVKTRDPTRLLKTLDKAVIPVDLPVYNKDLEMRYFDRRARRDDHLRYDDDYYDDSNYESFYEENYGNFLCLVPDITSRAAANAATTRYAGYVHKVKGKDFDHDLEAMSYYDHNPTTTNEYKRDASNAFKDELKIRERLLNADSRSILRFVEGTWAVQIDGPSILTMKPENIIAINA